MNLFDLVQDNLGDTIVDQLSGQMEGATREQTQAAASGIVSTLLAGLNKNAAQEGGVNSLVSALDRDHDGSILDDVVGFLGGSRQPANASMLNGAGILKHVLGGNQNNAMDMIGRMTGMDKSNIGKMMITLAPLVMGALGKARRQGMSTNQVKGLLSETVKSTANKRLEMNLITRFLDKDGDGSIMDDLANMGIKALLRR